MKVVRIGNTIVSLENVREVTITKQGTGSSRNPRQSRIGVHYQTKCDETAVWIDDTDGYPAGEAKMTEIMKILSEG